MQPGEPVGDPKPLFDCLKTHAQLILTGGLRAEPGADGCEPSATGIPRGGAALQGGLVVFGVCGRRMFTTYTDDGREARYVRHQMATTFGAPRCQSISTRPVDVCLNTLIIEALSPSAIEVSLQVAEDIEFERQQLHGSGSSGWSVRNM